MFLIILGSNSTKCNRFRIRPITCQRHGKLMESNFLPDNIFHYDTQNIIFFQFLAGAVATIECGLLVILFMMTWAT